MPRATQRFMDAIRLSHTVYSYCDVISPNQETMRLPVVDGEVTVDRTAQYRRATRVDCIDPEGVLIPIGASGILTPFGTEIRPYRGIQYLDGTTEVYPLGVFRIAKVTLTESSSSAGNSGVRIAIDAYDRSRTISRDKFTNVYEVAAGTNLLTAIQLILGRTFIDLEYDAISTALVTTAPQVFGTSDDPWEAVVKLAQSMGCEIYFDTEGRVVVAPPTDIDALPSPDFTYIEGQRSTMMDLSAVFTDEPGFNGIVVTGESPGDEKPPVRAEAWDDEPTSPTYRLGSYGEVPMFLTDNNVKTEEDAQRVADAMLKNQIGFAAQLSISSWVNPALEAGDVVEVRRPKMHVAGKYIVDAFNVPLRKDGTQNLKLRNKREVEEDTP